MPTIKKMLESFTEMSYKYREKKSMKILLGDEVYSLVSQEELANILNKNVIKTTDKTQLNQQIAEAMEESFKKIKRFKDKIHTKELYEDLVEFLNENYYFCIELEAIKEELIGTPEERCLYLLRETERENYGERPMGLTEIAEKLGCSRRQLEKDVQRMTEQGFKLLGQNIKLIDEDNSVLNMESTPHPIVLMQNISQILVIFEGLRAMEKIKAYRSFAHPTAINIWNQLTEYAQNKVLDAVELMNYEASDIEWYLTLREDSLEHRRFLTEIKSCEGNPSSQLMYLAKNQKPFHMTYINDEEKEVTIHDCTVSFFNPYSPKARFNTANGECEIEEDKIVYIEIL